MGEVWCEKCERPAEVTIRLTNGTTQALCRRHEHAVKYANAKVRA